MVSGNYPSLPANLLQPPGREQSRLRTYFRPREGDHAASTATLICTETSAPTPMLSRLPPRESPATIDLASASPAIQCYQTRDCCRHHAPLGKEHPRKRRSGPHMQRFSVRPSTPTPFSTRTFLGGCTSDFFAEGNALKFMAILLPHSLPGTIFDRVNGA